MDILDKIIAAESSGNLKKANKPNKISSALGLGQFIDETWLSMIKRYHPELRCFAGAVPAIQVRL